MKNASDRLISGSVGREGVNRKDDVWIIQFLFNLTTRSNFLPETGECDDPRRSCGLPGGAEGIQTAMLLAMASSTGLNLEWSVAERRLP